MYIGIIVYTEMASVRVQFESLGTGHYFWRWVVPKKNVFLVKNVLIQPLKSQKNVLPNLKYQLKNKYPLLAKTFTKGYHSVVTHVLYHFCDMSLITACAIFCSLKFHVVCTCTFFGDTICLLTNREMIKIVALIDLHIVLTYHFLLTLLFSLYYLTLPCWQRSLFVLGSEGKETCLDLTRFLVRMCKNCHDNE